MERRDLLGESVMGLAATGMALPVGAAPARDTIWVGAFHPATHQAGGLPAAAAEDMTAERMEAVVQVQAGLAGSTPPSAAPQVASAMAEGGSAGNLANPDLKGDDVLNVRFEDASGPVQPRGEATRRPAAAPAETASGAARVGAAGLPQSPTFAGIGLHGGAGGPTPVHGPQDSARFALFLPAAASAVAAGSSAAAPSAPAVSPPVSSGPTAPTGADTSSSFAALAPAGDPPSGDDNPPYINTPDDQANVEGDNVYLQLAGGDIDGDAITYHASSNLPPGVSYDTNTGVISGTIDAGAADFNGGIYTVSVWTDDGQLTSDTATFTWTITAGNQPPTVTPPLDQANAEGDVVSSVAVTGLDPDGDMLSYYASNLPAGLGIDSGTGAITGTIADGDADVNGGIYTVSVWAYDGQLSSDTATFTWTVTVGNLPPTVTPPGNQTNTEGDVVSSVSVTGSDPDGDMLSYYASNLPAGLSIDSLSGVITGTIATDAAGIYTVTVWTNDGQLNSDLATFNWTVHANHPPVIGPFNNRISAEGAIVNLALTGSDVDGDALSYAISGLPDGLSADSAGLVTGAISYDAAQVSNGSYPVTVTVTDTHNASDSASFTWTITNTNRKPTVTAPGDQTNSEEDVVQDVAVAGTDPDGDTLSYHALNLPAGLSIDSLSGAITGTTAADAAGLYTVTVWTNDGQLNSDLATFNWTVLANHPPVIGPLSNRINAEGAIVNLALTGSDVDGDALSYAIGGLPGNLGADSAGLVTGTISHGAAGSYLVTVTVTDTHNASASASFTWTITATDQPPTVTAPGNQTNAEGDVVSDVTVGGSDPDDDTLGYYALGLPGGLSIDNSTGVISGTIADGDADVNGGAYTVTVWTNDGQVNSPFASFTWTITAGNHPPHGHGSRRPAQRRGKHHQRRDRLGYGQRWRHAELRRLGTAGGPGHRQRHRGHHGHHRRRRRGPQQRHLHGHGHGDRSVGRQ